MLDQIDRLAVHCPSLASIQPGPFRGHNTIASAHSAIHDTRYFIHDSALRNEQSILVSETLKAEDGRDDWELNAGSLAIDLQIS